MTLPKRLLTPFLPIAVATLLACTSEESPRGLTGPAGPEGSQGLTGQQGPRGPEGQQGPQGSTGERGEDGAFGQDGVTAISLQFLGRYESGIFNKGASEIVSYDPSTQQVFQVNASSGKVDILDLSTPSAPVLVGSIDVAGAVAANTSLATPLGSVNSVSVKNGVVATAIAAESNTDLGVAAFFQSSDTSFIAAYEVGFLPDSIVLSPDGSVAVVANEGEPLEDYTVDPIGSISVIDISAGAGAATLTTLDFSDFNAGGERAAELDPTIRIYGVKAGDGPSTVAEDLEPEYVAFSSDSTTAFVSLQENNAIAVIDLSVPRIESLLPLGFKDHNRIGNELDVSDMDHGIILRNWPVLGIVQPDTLATYEFQGETLIVTANEGDSRSYAGFSEEARIKDLTLDPVAFPEAADLQLDENLGRLLTTVVNGDDDLDGDYDRLFSFGGRSFSIYTESGRRLFDSGNHFELVTAFRVQEGFNANNIDNVADSCSVARGPEPEALALGRIGHATFAFIGLERVSGIMVYNISNPHHPRFVEYVIDRNFGVDPSLGDNDSDGIEESNPAAGDLGPESIVFIPAADSPNGENLLVVGNEVSGTTSIYQINVIRE